MTDEQPALTVYIKPDKSVFVATRVHLSQEFVATLRDAIADWQIRRSPSTLIIPEAEIVFLDASGARVA